MNVKPDFFHLKAKHNKTCPVSNVLIKKLQSALFLVTLLFSFSAQARLPHQLEKVGDGTMSWMFLDIYNASLFTTDGDYSSAVYPQVLTLNYLKSINKKRLINATKEQWILQGFEDAKMKGWLQSLQQIWPDIKSGDSLTFYVNENKKGFFYHNKILLGGINSEDFSNAFLAIWLSDKTSQPELRRDLLGL
jgi:hypothetical protein